MKTKEIRKDKTSNFSIKIAADQMTEVMQKDIEKSSARIFDNGKIYSSNYLGSASEEQLIEMAINNKFSAINYDYDLNKDITKSSKSGAKLTDSQVVKKVSDLLELFKKELPDFTFNGQVEHVNNLIETITSNAINLSDSNSKTEGYFTLKKIGSPNIMDSFFEFRLNDEDIFKDDINDFLNFHKAWDKTASLNSGSYPVIFVDNSRDFLSKIMESINPELYHQNAALYSGKKGAKIFNEKITLREITHDEKFGILKEYDDEGNKVEKYHPIINAGVFTGPLYDKQAAKKYNTNPTGHSSRDYNSAISPVNYPLDFIPSNKKLSDIYNEFEKIIVVFMAGGGDTTSNGDYSSPVQLSFLVEGGVIKGKLGDITISNNINNMLGSDFIDVIGQKVQLSLHYPFMCKMNVLI